MARVVPGPHAFAPVHRGYTIYLWPFRRQFEFSPRTTRTVGAALLQARPLDEVLEVAATLNAMLAKISAGQGRFGSHRLYSRRRQSRNHVVLKMEQISAHQRGALMPSI